jgi:signal transduction histidine kinase
MRKNKMTDRAGKNVALGKRGSSVIMRFATSTGLLALAVVILAIIFFHTIRGDVFQGAFQAPLKDWSATIAGHIGGDITKAQAVAKNHRIGIIVWTESGNFAFDPEGEPIEPDRLLEHTSGFRQIEAHIQHATEHGGDGLKMHYTFLLNKDEFDDDRTPMIIGLVYLLLYTICLAYLMQVSLLRPLKWLHSGVEAVSAGDFSTRVPVVRNDEIGKVARAFNEMTTRVQEMMDDRERLLADVSHELRSPLARIKVALELLPEGEKRNAIAQDIREMESLTTALLEREQMRTKLQTGESETGFETINLIAVTGDVVDGFQNTTPGINLNVPPHSLEIEGDKTLVKILIHNLVDNAVKFSLADSAPIEVTLSRGDGDIQIIVKDDGIGIPRDRAEKVFEPFVKLNPARGHRSGYGLGLNLCQRIVQAMGGHIEMQQMEQQRGTRVSVTLPKS